MSKNSIPRLNRAGRGASMDALFDLHALEIPRNDGLELACGGFDPSALILTSDGAIPLQFLSLGDKVITREQGYVPVTGLMWFQTSQALTVRPGFERFDCDCDRLIARDQDVTLRDWRARAFSGADQCTRAMGRMIDDANLRPVAGLVSLMRLCLAKAATAYIDGLNFPLPGFQMAASNDDQDRFRGKLSCIERPLAAAKHPQGIH